MLAAHAWQGEGGGSEQYASHSPRSHGSPFVEPLPPKRLSKESQSCWMDLSVRGSRANTPLLEKCLAMGRCILECSAGSVVLKTLYTIWPLGIITLLL